MLMKTDQDNIVVMSVVVAVQLLYSASEEEAWKRAKLHSGKYCLTGVLNHLWLNKSSRSEFLPQNDLDIPYLDQVLWVSQAPKCTQQQAQA